MTKQIMNVLVLGGTGAIGAELVKILAERGSQVSVTTRVKRDFKCKNINYLIGNAHEETFLKTVLEKRYDVIFDFMVYGTDEFRSKVHLFLNNTNQYIFLSSSRVYADVGKNNVITEETPKLLDVCEDEIYRKTDEYALAKARQEEILRTSGYENWTIVRPYITYNSERLQLGVFEKEKWLYRALKGKAIVFSKDIGEKTTTMTFGGDVALLMADLAANPKALSAEFQIAGNDSMKWKDVLALYLNELEALTGKRPKVYWEEDSGHVSEAVGFRYQICYDRLYDRKFDSKKICQVCNSNYEFVPMKEGLVKCLQEFITCGNSFGAIDLKFEAYADRVAKEHMKRGEIANNKDKIKYIMWRYKPGITDGIMKIKKQIFRL